MPFSTSILKGINDSITQKLALAHSRLADKIIEISKNENCALLSKFIPCPTPDCENFFQIGKMKNQYDSGIEMVCKSCGKIFCGNFLTKGESSKCLKPDGHRYGNFVRRSKVVPPRMKMLRVLTPTLMRF